MSARALVTTLSILAMIAAGCGGGDGDDATTTASTTASTSTTSTSTTTSTTSTTAPPATTAVPEPPAAPSPSAASKAPKPAAAEPATAPAPAAPAPRPANSRPGSVGGCPLFPRNSYWYADVSTLPVHPGSAAYVNRVGANGQVHPDFLAGLWEGGPIGMPYAVVSADQPLVPISFHYANESDPGPYPIPPNVPIEEGAHSDGDRHILVVQEGTCLLHEVFDARPDGNGGWTGGSGAVWDLNSTGMRPAEWTSADAAGMPILPGLVRYEEVAAGDIPHAIRMSVPNTQSSYVWPASHMSGSGTDPALPPMGTWFRLRADFDISGFPPQARVVLQALKTHGAIIADNGPAWMLAGVPDERWDNGDLLSLHQVPGSAFEAVDVSSIANPGSLAIR